MAILAKPSDSRATVNRGLAGEAWPFWRGRGAGTEEDKGLSMLSPTDRRGWPISGSSEPTLCCTQACEADPTFSSFVIPPIL